ncbi:hypothetical protein M569_07278 [Genlisea aurea]|uniref:Uncharacterized protein n=1 Tax=Genlisea aurea TaxID=192259 RepID=S8CRK8_9LAMI|nr:hypothetical protein M569_07278 [Genlisea aurea]
MDKSKNRKDLLAAGRKKLQQFRQKKDNKAGDGDSSSKDTKSGHDAAEANATESAPRSAEEEVTINNDMVAIPILESGSGMEPQVVDAASSTDEVMAAKVGVLETGSSGQAAEFSSEGSHLDLSRNADEELASGAMVLKEGANSSLGFKVDERISMPDYSDATDLKAVQSSEPEYRSEEQVTDIGDTQEVGISSKAQNSEADNTRPLSVYWEAIADSAITFLENIPETQSTQVHLEVSKMNDSVLSVGASEDIQADALDQHAMADNDILNSDSMLSSSLNSEQSHHSEYMSCDSSAEMNLEVLPESADHGVMQFEGSLLSSDHPIAERSFDSGADGTTQYLASRKVEFSSALDGNIIRLSQLAETLQTLGEDEVAFLLKSRGIYRGNFREMDKMEAHVFFERLQEELYVTSFSKEAFYLYLCESEKLFDENSTAKTSIMEVQGINELLAADIAQCKQELQQALLSKQEFQKELLNSKDEVKVLSAKASDLQNKLEIAYGEISALSSDLVDCRRLVDDLQAGNEELHRSLKVMTEDKLSLSEENENILLEKLKIAGELEESRASFQSLNDLIAEERRHFEEKNDSILHENSKLLAGLEDLKHAVEAVEAENKNLNEKQSHELAAVKASATSLQENYDKAMNDLNEAIIRINRLTEENEALNVDLELQKSKLNQVDLNKFSYLSEKATAGRLDNFTTMNFISDVPPEETSDPEVYDDPSGFISLVKKLQSAEILVQKLGSDIESILSEKPVAPGVSKLIQAFESKTHVDDHQDLDKPSLSSVQKYEDSRSRSKMMMENLGTLLKELLCDAESIRGFCQLSRNKQLDAAVAGKLSIYDSLELHTELVEKEHLEYMVLCEALLDHMHFMVLKEEEFLKSFDTLQKDESDLRSDNNQLRERLGYCHGKISELQENLDTLCRESAEFVTSVSIQLECLQGEVNDRELKHQVNWSSFCSKVLPNVEMLDETVKRFCAAMSKSGDNDLDITSRVVSSIISANSAIEELHGQLKAAGLNTQELSDNYIWAVSRLYSMHIELSELWDRAQGDFPDETHNIQSFDDPISLLDQLQEIFSESLKLNSEYKQEIVELRSRVSELDELVKKCMKSDTIMKLIEEIMQITEAKIVADEPASHLESLIYSLVQRCKEVEQGLSLSLSREMQLNALEGEVGHLTDEVICREIENLVSKQFLRCAQESVTPLYSQLKEKVAELEQSEHRVSSLREKLGIAVTKGKGLISQRDSLKQSLAENSKELDRCLQELQSKDVRIHELETKIKDFSEAGERMEALESELSYIRNSATALRESFLLKDSVLQRIEEILEDLELPEHFHSRDIIEKVDWLSKSIGGHAFPLGDGDQRSVVEEVSYSDSGFVGIDLKDNAAPNTETIDDLRRAFDELQSKFYGLAEQNEMLEQSLMERNYLVQCWEEILDKAEMPSQLRSMEPEDKLQWLESSLTDARRSCYSLQQKIDDLESLCRSQAADAEDSQVKAAELESAFQNAFREKEILSRDLDILRNDSDEHLKRMADRNARIADLESEVNTLQEQKSQMEVDLHHARDAIRRLQELNDDFNIRNEDFQNELIVLQKQKVLLEESIHRTENEVSRLHQLACDALQEDSHAEDIIGQEAVKCLEEILMRLIKNYNELRFVKTDNVDPVDLNAVASSSNERGVGAFSSDPEDSLGELARLKEEIQNYLLNSQSLHQKLEELEMRNRDLGERHNEEQQKSASLREKLNVAVRKGKSLVQHRDAMKQNIEQLNLEVEQLKSENEQLKKAVSEHEEQIQKLYGIQESVRAAESENSFFKDRLAETEHWLEEKATRLNDIVNHLDDIGGGLKFSTENPFEKLKQIGNYLIDLQNDLDSSQQESSKSKRAAELLLAELNEVQERNDTLQEELVKAHNELSILSGEKDLAENAKDEVLAHIENLVHSHSEDKDKLLSEIVTLKSGIAGLGEDLSAVASELHDVLSRDLLVLQCVKTALKSFLEPRSIPDMNSILPSGSFSGTMSWKSENEVLTRELTSLRKRLYNHSYVLQEEASELSELVISVHRDYTTQKDTCESVKSDLKKFELIAEEKESELHSSRGKVALLYEACAAAISEIESCKNHVLGKALPSSKPPPERKSESEKPLLGGSDFSVDEDEIRGMHDRVLLGARDLMNMQNELLEVGHLEMKNTILNLQKELQEKDIQTDRICSDFVNQIKEAETRAESYSDRLRQMRALVDDSKTQVKAMGDEQEVLRQKIKELEDQETDSRDLQEKLASKTQEIEALMQALEEQEAEMEELTSKVSRFENELREKSKEAESIESSRTKALKKLSVTVSKFDELHFLSESLLSEVERLQGELQERDGEVSFLRQEVTRSTNDVLSMTQINKNFDGEIQELLTWLDSSVPSRDAAGDKSEIKESGSDGRKEELRKKISEMVSELESVKAAARNNETLLDEERNKAAELKNSLREKESQLSTLRSAGNSAKAAVMSPSEIIEVEQMANKWISPGPITPQVRSLRKPNNDQVAVVIDKDYGNDRLVDDDEDDDDKAHGFKSLTTSKFVPRFTRPVSDVIDGLWMSCDRALMRRPSLRLVVIFYWAVIHALLAAYVV